MGILNCSFSNLGSSYILIKKGLVGLTPIQLGSFRILMTTLILLPIGYKYLRGLTMNQWKWLVFTGFVGTFFLVFICFFRDRNQQFGSCGPQWVNPIVYTYHCLFFFCTIHPTTPGHRGTRWIFWNRTTGSTRVFVIGNGRWTICRTSCYCRIELWNKC